MHAEAQIGDSVVMIAEATEKWPAMPACIHLYVEDCDAIYQRAVDAGAEVVQELANQFYGDRSGGVRDPGGNLWWITSHVEDVDLEEITRRARDREGQTAERPECRDPKRFETVGRRPVGSKSGH